MTLRRRIVIVSGAPGAGKTTLAIPLAKQLGFALFSKDLMKETFTDTLGVGAGDLAASRRIGGAAMELLWMLARHTPRPCRFPRWVPLRTTLRGWKKSTSALMRCEGVDIARCTVERLMCDLDLQGVVRAKPVRVTISDNPRPPGCLRSCCSHPPGHR